LVSLGDYNGAESKQFPIAELVAIEFRSEIFNAFNRGQYGQPSVTSLYPLNSR
jgi:hypothetical protein